MPESHTGRPSWMDRLRRWLWLDGPRRTDSSEANRGFYLSRKPVGWRFTLAVVAVGIAIGLVLLNTREAEARSAVDEAQPASAIAVVVDDASAGG